ncbi:hypothetical protein ACX27_01845 [Nostoc piscinale CENA21]|uniref:Uncharacterized protein n=1 Tax=Nostoc piscinale CENA21 TaxID=224013 RepID=A0A0M4SHU7_9NOSO|nr:hypothetical protein [Nostoc piscinale]ALF51872.1 hypothetical protein ACX27_01845 [Nostoc piscinale CENA21]
MPLTIPPSTYASQISFSSVNGLTSSNVNSAIDEVYSESVKLDLANILTEILTLTNSNTATSTTTGTLRLPGIGMGNGNIYLATPPTTDNNQKAATTAFVNNYISRGTDSGGRQFIRFGNSSGSGLLIKFGTSVPTISANTGSISYGGTPGFSSILNVIACNGDGGANDSHVNVSSWSNTGFNVKTPTLSSGNYRVNWIVFGVPA